MKEKIHYLEHYSSSWSPDSLRIINTPSATARNTFFYVQETGYFKTFPPYFTERANLQSFLLVYTLSGQGCLRYGNREYTLTPGQIFYINCMEHHYYECSDKEGWEILWLHFNGSGALGYYEEFSNPGFRVLTLQDTFFVESTMKKILSLTSQKAVHSEIICSGLIVSLLTELLVQNSADTLSPAATPAYLKDIVRYIDQHFKEPVTLEGLSQTFSVSKFHLSREFKKYFGRTFMDYLIGQRLSYSKELLRFTRLPVSEIAYSCGMNNVSHFISLFKQREGMTPLSYRNEWS